MRKISNILIVTGLMLFLSPFIVPFVLPILPPIFHKFSFLLLIAATISPVLVIVGLVMRFSTTKTPSGLLDTEDTKLSKKYILWRNANIVGIILWFPMWFSTIMLYGGSGMAPNVVFTFIFHVLALPIAIGALIAARIKKVTAAEKAVFILKLPFYYAAAGFLILTLLESFFK